MLRRYWGIIAAIAGLIVASGLAYVSYEFNEAAQQRNASYNYQPASKARFPVWMEDQTKPKEYQPNCNKPQDREDADLCAQWAAVAQVTEANRLSSLSLQLSIGTLIFTIIGTGLLIWTLSETRQTARRELRAYLSFRPLGVRNLIGSHNALGQVRLVNAGQSPAYDVFVEVRLKSDNRKDFSDFEISSDPMSVARTVQPGHDMIQGSEDYIGVRQIRPNGGYIYVWGVAYYTDTFGKRRWTRFCHRYDMASRDAGAVGLASNQLKGAKEAHILIDAEKARHHQYGNDAD